MLRGIVAALTLTAILVGAMYTTPKRYSENDLNKGVSLSFAQWYKDVHR